MTRLSKSSRKASNILTTGIANQKDSMPSKLMTCVNKAGNTIKSNIGARIDPASLTLCERIANASSTATTITANNKIAAIKSNTVTIDSSGNPITLDDAK